MSHEHLEELEERVAEFLAQREVEPELAPEAFAALHPRHGAALLAALRSALEVQALLASGAPVDPQQVGPYRVLGRLGRGGMGVVHEVERDGRRFALKVLATELAASPRALERFQREARALARLDHPGLVRVHDTGLFRGAPYLVMAKVEGRPLASLELPLAPERAARIVLALARAVAAAHGAGVLHRDLKPANVLLGADDVPVLVDFGLGAAEDEVTLTSSGALLGTPRYMAPEQAAGERADARTDVHGLGLILFELLAGRPARSEGSRAEVLARAQRAAPRLDASVPAGLARLVGAALAQEPRRRPESAARLAEELERFLSGARVRLAPPRLDQRLLDRARRRPLAAGLGVALGTAVLLALAAVLAPSAAERSARAARALAAEAQAGLARGDTDAAVELALASVEHTAASGGDASAELPRLLGLAEAPPATVAALERRLARGDERALLHFALAYAHDSAHRLRAAAESYGRALARDPELLRAHLNLAHLHSGAQLGACQACERAYAAAPETLAPERALAHLRRALELDHGASEACVGRVVQTALALGARVPHAHAPEAVAALLEELLAASAPPPAARLRLEEGLARLRGATGTRGATQEELGARGPPR
ncbi:MAG TPA: serine/threonine-protein kinase [Planctomycetota bacterium]